MCPRRAIFCTRSGPGSDGKAQGSFLGAGGAAEVVRLRALRVWVSSSAMNESRPEVGSSRMMTGCRKVELDTQQSSLVAHSSAVCCIAFAVHYLRGLAFSPG